MNGTDASCQNLGGLRTGLVKHFNAWLKPRRFASVQREKCCCRDVTGNVPTDVQHDSAFKPMAMGYARECAVPSAPSWEGLSLLESMLLAEAASILAAPRYACHVQFSTSGISLP